MHDIKWIREHAGEFDRGLARRGLPPEAEKLIALDVLPALVDPVWDTTRLLDDSGRVGGLIASFTGYRARPALLALLALALYWSLLWMFLKRSGARSAAMAPVRPAVDTMPRAGRN